MYIESLRKNHLEDVAKLEAKTYPEHMCLGLEDYAKDFEKYTINYSTGVFSKGELKGYIIALCNYTDDHIYVSDLVCENKRHIKELLLSLVYSTRYSRANKIKFECRYTSNKIVEKLLKEYENIELISKKHVPNYYGEEDMWQYIIKINNYDVKVNFKSMKELIRYLIHIEKIETLNTLLQKLFLDDYSYITGKTFEERYDTITKNKSYILNVINNYHKEKWAMVATAGDNVRMSAKLIKGYKNTEEWLETYVNKGYLVESRYFAKSLFNRDYNKDNIVSRVGFETLMLLKRHENTLKYSDSLSSYRRFFMKEIKFIGKERGLESLTVHDKYGYAVRTIQKTDKHNDIIPYNFSNTFDAVIKRISFKYICYNELKEHIKANEYDSVEETVYFGWSRSAENADIAVDSALKIRRLVDEETAFDFIKKMAKYDVNSSWLHDWSYTYGELLSETSSKLFTKGAYKRIVETYSFGMLGELNKVSKLVASYFTKKRLHQKRKEQLATLRKNVSRAIRKDNYNEALNILSQELNTIDSIEIKKIGFKSKALNQKAIAFVDDMRRYNNMLTMTNVIEHLGKDNFKDILNGDIEGLFEPEKISFERGYVEFGKWLQNHIKSLGRSKQGMKLYNVLRKISPIEDIFNGDISSEIYEKTTKELKIRSIKVPKELTICNQFELRVEEKCSPNYLMAGDATVCCMSFGQEKSKTYALEKGFGVINVYYKDKVIANTVIWINKPENCLVLDNIEVAPNYKKEHIKFNLKDLFKKAAGNLVKKHKLDFAVQGNSYNDLELYEELSNPFRLSEIDAVDVLCERFYTDATQVHMLNVA